MRTGTGAIRAETGTDEATPDQLRLGRYATERSPLPMVVVEGQTHLVRYVNPAFCHLAGKEREELIGRPFAVAVPEEDENECLALLDRVYRTGETENLADQQHAPYSSPGVYWSYSAWAIFDEKEVPVGVMIQVTDTTQALLTRQLVGAISQALTLSSVRLHELTETAELRAQHLQQALRETDHRTKNNLQAVASLLDMKIMAYAETVPVNELIQLRRQMKMLASIHEMLVAGYATSPTATLISAKAALQKLLPMLQQIVGTERIQWSAGEVLLPVKQVMSLVLLINELVCNAIKHGGRQVELRLATSDNMVRLEVCDDGPGFSQSFDSSAITGFGLEFIESASRLDLHGKTTYANRPEGGACVTITFPLPPTCQKS